MYRKEKSKIAHGWSVLKPDNSFLCWVSDAAVANDIVSELNVLKARADANALQSSRQGVASKIPQVHAVGKRDSGDGSKLLRQRF